MRCLWAVLFGVSIQVGCAGNDDLNPCVPAAEECNARDDDCNGLVDLDTNGAPLRRDCSNACGPGQEECNYGLWSFCTAPQPTTETCDGFDNDCDNIVDNGCLCRHGETRQCGIDVGICDYGVEHCERGFWGDCRLPYDPTSLVELCGDGLDNDCDGNTDEECLCEPGEIQPCGEDEGECVAGSMTCLEDSTWADECVGEVGPSEEVCDGLDNDCDGEIDLSAASGFGWRRDSQEPNDTCQDRANIFDPTTGIAEIHEGDGWISLRVDDPSELSSFPNIYPAGEEDWYYIRAIESTHGCVPWTNQCTFHARIRLELKDRVMTEWLVQRYEDYRLCVVAGTCSDAMNPDHVVCTHERSWNEADNSYYLDVLWIGSCGSDDSRDLYIRVHSPTEAACGHYQISLTFWYDNTIPCP